MFGGKFGIAELLVILVIVLILFGPKQLPKLSKMFGKSIKGFKDGLEEETSEEDAPADKSAEKAAPAEKSEAKPAAPADKGEEK